jgi:hypothetical protein
MDEGCAISARFTYRPGPRRNGRDYREQSRGVGLKLMAISLSDILASLQNGTTAINGLSKQVKTTFPQRGEFSTAARGSLGAVTLNASQATGFIPVTTSSGFTGYVAIYPSS